jgi:NarL family two-component system response regulator LiaR
MTPIRIVLVEDHALVRAGLRTSLHAADMVVVGEAGDGIIGREVILEHQPTVAVIDLGLPGKDGITLTRELKASGYTAGIVVLTMREREEQVLAALAAGADAYCVKASSPSVVIDAIRAVAAGGAYFDPLIASIVLRRFVHVNSPSDEPSPLTPRETEILALIADGDGNARICERLHLSLGTVKSYIASILAKLAASDRAHAAAIAFRRGLLR